MTELKLEQLCGSKRYMLGEKVVRQRQTREHLGQQKTILERHKTTATLFFSVDGRWCKEGKGGITLRFLKIKKKDIEQLLSHAVPRCSNYLPSNASFLLAPQSPRNTKCLWM